MKHKLVMVVLCMATLLSVAAVADAGIIWMNRAGASGGDKGGGEFTVHVVDGTGLPVSAGDTFFTFCLEYYESIKLGVTNQYGAVVSDVSNTLSYAHLGSGPLQVYAAPGDPLDFKSAYLYSMAMAGTLLRSDGFAYKTVAGEEDADANSLQAAIWHIEEELLTTDAQALAWITEAGNANWTTLRNVRVLNLYGLDSNGDIDLTDLKQSQLILVPLPSAAVVGMVMLLGLAVLKLRRRR